MSKIQVKAIQKGVLCIQVQEGIVPMHKGGRSGIWITCNVSSVPCQEAHESPKEHQGQKVGLCSNNEEDCASRGVLSPLLDARVFEISLPGFWWVNPTHLHWKSPKWKLVSYHGSLSKFQVGNSGFLTQQIHVRGSRTYHHLGMPPLHESQGRLH